MIIVTTFTVVTVVVVSTDIYWADSSVINSRSDSRLKMMMVISVTVIDGRKLSSIGTAFTIVTHGSVGRSGKS